MTRPWKPRTRFLALLLVFSEFPVEIKREKKWKMIPNVFGTHAFTPVGIARAWESVHTYSIEATVEFCQLLSQAFSARDYEGGNATTADTCTGSRASKILSVISGNRDTSVTSEILRMDSSW